MNVSECYNKYRGSKCEGKSDKKITSIHDYLQIVTNDYESKWIWMIHKPHDDSIVVAFLCFCCCRT